MVMMMVVCTWPHSLCLLLTKADAIDGHEERKALMMAMMTTFLRWLITTMVMIKMMMPTLMMATMPTMMMKKSIVTQALHQKLPMKKDMVVIQKEEGIFLKEEEKEPRL